MPLYSQGTQETIFQSSINFKKSNLTKWRKAKARVTAGTGRGRILCIGDSTTAGVGATDSTGRLRQSWVYYMTQMLNSAGITAINKSFFGYQGVSSGNYTTFNPEIALGTGWGANTNSTLHGQPFFNNSGTGAIAFTPGGTTDSAEFFNVGNLTGTYSWDINGGTATNVVISATPGYIRQTPVTFTRGTNVFNLKRVSGDCRIAGAILWDSQTPAVDVLNLGRGSATSTVLVDTVVAYGSIACMNTLGPTADLAIINVGINDYTPASLVDLDTYRANLTTMITTLSPNVDVALCVPVPSDATRQSLAIQQQYCDVVRLVAATYDLPVIDLVQAWSSYVSSNALGYMFDTVHPTIIGYADIGRCIGYMLNAV